MKEFIRTEEHIQNMTIDSLIKNVEMDLVVEIQYDWRKNKLKAYSPKLKCYLQFPKNLREQGKRYICDATESSNGGRTFYRAYKGSIRDMDGNIVA